MKILASLFSITSIIFLSGCVAPHKEYIAATVEVDPTLARIELRRSRLSTGGKIRYYVLDTGAVVADNKTVPRSTIHCSIPAAKHPLEITGRTSDKGCNEGLAIKATINKGAIKTYSSEFTGRRMTSIRQSSDDGILNCQLAPKPNCVHGVEIGELGPGNTLVWNRHPGPLKISIFMGGVIVGGSGYRIFNKELTTKAGETYYLKASYGKIVVDKK